MQMDNSEEYMVCRDCRGYYKLQEGENPEDFEKCQCGGILKYYGNGTSSKHSSKAEMSSYTNQEPPCRRCGAKSPQGSEFCFRCGTPLTENEKSSGGPNEMETSEVNENLKGEIRSWGKGLVFIGVIQIISMGFLDPSWGVLLITAGLVSFKVVHRAMFLVYGTIILFAGLGNLMVGGLLTAFSILQFVIGLKQFQKFFQWKNVNEKPD